MNIEPSLPPSCRYRLDLQYIGTNFQGWQSQPGGGGIQDHLEKALKTILRHPVRVTAASRTDTGVHAEQQVVVFKTSLQFAPRAWLKSLQGLLPESVGVARITPVDESFHPIFSAKAKVYRYRIWQGVTRQPMLLPFVWPVMSELNIEAMREAARALIGRHDFSSFCAVDSSAKTRERCIREIVIEGKGPLLEIWICGEGFLKKMVSIIVGTLVAVGNGKLPVKAAQEILAARDRKAAGKTAPGAGLSLVAIFYDEVLPLVKLIAEVQQGYAVKLWP